MLPDQPEQAEADAIEQYLIALALPFDLPEQAIAACIERYSEAGPLLRLALERFAAGEPADETVGTLLFRALHIMGGVRDDKAFEPLVRLLGRPTDDVDWLLGDAVIQTLPRILIGTFSGDAEVLFDAIADQTRGEVVRDSLLRAATFLTWEGRIDRARMVAFLEKFGTGELAAASEFVWNAWIDAVALLGLRELEPLVTETRSKNLIGDMIFFDRDEFRAQLERAERDPADALRFTELNLGYLEHVLDALRTFADEEEGDEDAPDWTIDDEQQADNPPIINPWRHVGRNDPCPCGSGKKAKRCCLAD